VPKAAFADSMQHVRSLGLSRPDQNETRSGDPRRSAQSAEKPCMYGAWYLG
jgi:hypothetical protein